MELKLAHEGYEVKTLPNGEEAISLLETGEFALLICDLVMPRIDGFKILEEIKDWKERTFYISGPPSMVENTEKVVKNLGLPNSQIKTDFFPGFA